MCRPAITRRQCIPINSLCQIARAQMSITRPNLANFLSNTQRNCLTIPRLSVSTYFKSYPHEIVTLTHYRERNRSLTGRTRLYRSGGWNCPTINEPGTPVRGRKGAVVVALGVALREPLNTIAESPGRKRAPRIPARGRRICGETTAMRAATRGPGSPPSLFARNAGVSVATAR